jgi:PmbA protein
VSIVTGDYSRGAAGFWIENGRLAHPVEEVTVAGNLRDMFRSIRCIGDDLDARSNLRTGSLCIDGMTVGGS